MSDDPLVSVIIPYYNPRADFMKQAIDSVLHQTYQAFEVLLIDDGSGPESAAVATEYAERFPTQVRIYYHSGRQNRGSSASRTLGLQYARGKYVAFLDADDIWLAEKLKDQVALLEAHPEAAMLYGNTLYWHRWAGNESDLHLDYMPRLNLHTERVYQPPSLLPLYLEGKTAVPCTCSLIVRCQAVEDIGGFEDAFPGMYDDQVFYAKISLEAPIYVSSRCWDQYRQHAGSMSAFSRNNSMQWATRLVFLEWLEGYLTTKGVHDPEIWQALRRAMWLNRNPNYPFLSETGRMAIRRSKKWLLKFEEWLLPVPIRRQIWAREFKPE